MRCVQMLAGALLLLGSPQSFIAQQSSSIPVIMAAGRGEIRLPPDVAVVRLVISSRASTAAAAATETARRVRAITDTLHRWSLAPEIAAPVAFEVHTNEDRFEARLVDYEAKAVLTVRVREFEQLGPIVDAALAAGATTVPGIRFESDTAAVARMRAIAVAYEQAEAKASAVARAANVKLGPLMVLDTGDEYDFGEYDEYIGHPLDLPSARAARRDVPVSAVVRAEWRLVATGK